MWIYAGKIGIAIAAALILLFLVRKYLRNNQETPRFVRSLPGNMVQEIADRLGIESAVEQYLGDFFQIPYQGEKRVICCKEEFDSCLAELTVPPEEKEDLLRVLGAIEVNDLLAYALKPEQEQKPRILALCRVEADSAAEKEPEGTAETVNSENMEDASGNSAVELWIYSPVNEAPRPV